MWYLLLLPLLILVLPLVLVLVLILVRVILLLILLLLLLLLLQRLVAISVHLGPISTIHAAVAPRLARVRVRVKVTW